MISPWIYAGLVKGDYNLRDSDYILNVVSKYYRVSKEDILGSKRFAKFVLARHTVIKLLKEYTNLFLKDIGKVVGGIDHSTCIHAIKAMNDRLEVDKLYQKQYKELLNKL